MCVTRHELLFAVVLACLFVYFWIAFDRPRAMNFVRALGRVPIAYPFAFGFVFSGTKNGAADALVQRTVEDADAIDWRRVGIFSTFGALFCGIWQYTLFSRIMPRLYPGAASFAAKSWREKLADKQGMKELGIQVFLENGINNPILYFPVFYSVKIGMETREYNPFTVFPKGVARCVGLVMISCTVPLVPF